jgi:hypothetical protein
VIRRLPMTVCPSVPPGLRAAIRGALDRFPPGVAANLRGRPGGEWPGWRIEVVGSLGPHSRGGECLGWCRPWEARILFARLALSLPAGPLTTLAAHELLHGHAYTAYPAGTWAVEEEINLRLVRWGFDVAGLFEATADMRHERIKEFV